VPWPEGTRDSKVTLQGRSSVWWSTARYPRGATVRYGEAHPSRRYRVAGPGYVTKIESLVGDRAGARTPAWGATWSTCHPLKGLRREQGMPSVDVRASRTDRNYRHARACARPAYIANLRNLLPSRLEIIIGITRSRSLVIAAVHPRLFARVSSSFACRWLQTLDKREFSRKSKKCRVKKCISGR